jgi:hypothetical protein
MPSVRLRCGLWSVVELAPQVRISTWLCGPPPSNGQRQRYPSRFLYNLRREYPAFFFDTLHMFCGQADVGFGTTTDMRPESKPQIVAPYDAIPRPDASFSNVLADPPYADHYQKQWGGELPKPKRILAEAARLCRPGGLIGILHIIIVPAYKSCAVRRIAVHPILSGPNNALRVFNVFQRAAVEEHHE